MSDTPNDSSKIKANEIVLSEVEDAIRHTAGKLLEAGAADLQQFADRLTPMLVWAAAEGNEEVARSVARQARLLAEVQRIRASDAAWAAFYETASTIASIAIRVATNVLLAGAASVVPDDPTDVE